MIKNAMKTMSHAKPIKFAAAFAAAVLALCSLFPLAAQAANEYNSIDIVVTLNDDGSAHITEKWDVVASQDTEFYTPKQGLDNEAISNFKVTDETGRVFEDIGEWNVDASFDEKAYKSGVVTKSDGYELCFGISSYGPHVYTLEYDITNIVKGYEDADGIQQVFLKDTSTTVGSVSLTIEKPGLAFTTDDTKVWGAGMTGEIEVQDGVVKQWTTSGYVQGSTFETMVQFDKGMFHPADERSGKFSERVDAALAGTDYETRVSDYVSTHGGYGYMVWQYIRNFIPFILMAVFVFGAGWLIKAGKGSSTLSKFKPEYKDPMYSRDLPWQGSLTATYSRLKDLGRLGSDGDIIGAFMLKWMRTRQVEITSQEAGGFFNKNEMVNAIKLFQPRGDMPQLELQLYNMLVAAAGPDYVLQTKEFEKWAKRNYSSVEAWMESYQNAGKDEMRKMGALETVAVKKLIFTVNESHLTPAGEDLTVKMFGFKKYLEDFTIINEREPREVQLWDQYLVYAQLFGIAQKVAEQFKNLYPNYFQDYSQQYGGAGNMSMLDWMILTNISRDFGRAANQGYMAGLQAAQRAASGGGGSTFSGGGFSGGGFSGGGGGSFGSR